MVIDRRPPPLDFAGNLGGHDRRNRHPDAGAGRHHTVCCDWEKEVSRSFAGLSDADAFLSLWMQFDCKDDADHSDAAAYANLCMQAMIASTRMRKVVSRVRSVMGDGIIHRSSACTGRTWVVRVVITCSKDKFDGITLHEKKSNNFVDFKSCV
jgi:hypothetical protein